MVTRLHPCWMCLAVLLSTTGCHALVIPSVRYHEGAATCAHHGQVEPIAEDCQQPCSAQLHLPAIPHFGPPDVEQVDTSIRPPHSRFHPVPTQPVFAPRAEYSDPIPMGADGQYLQIESPPPDSPQREAGQMPALEAPGSGSSESPPHPIAPDGGREELMPVPPRNLPVPPRERSAARDGAGIRAASAALPRGAVPPNPLR